MMRPLTTRLERMDSMVNRLEFVEKENQVLKHLVSGLREELDEIKRDQIQCVPDAEFTDRPPESPDHGTYTQFTQFSCTADTVTLSCANNRTILTTSANYGQYANNCSACCAPNPGYDCTELVEENRPSDWLAIQALCDGQTSCQFQNLGSIIDSCQAGYQSDYIQLFFDCLPMDDVAGAVAFTAWASTGYPTPYTQYDIIIFDAVITNIGGHYNPATSSFVCPWHGVYVFSVAVQGYLYDQAHIDLMRNSEYLTRIWIDDISDVYNRGSTTTVIECHSGDVIWNRAGSTCNIHAYDRRTIFTGYMLQRL